MPRNIVLCTLTIVSCLASLPAAAQTMPPGGLAPQARPERPYRGLFGSSVGNTAQSLTLTSSLGGGMVENPVAEQGASTPSGAEGTGRSGSGVGSAALEYSMSRTRWGINASNQAMFDYYPKLSEHRMLPRDIFSGSVYFLPSKSTRVTFTQNFKNLPELSYSELFDPELGQGAPVAQDLALTMDRYTRYGSALDVSHSFSQRTRADVGVSYARGMINERSWTIATFNGGISHNIAKGLALYLGYQDGGQRNEGEEVGSSGERQPRINGGIDFNRALSFSRRTTLSFMTGVAGVHDRSLDETNYHLIGAAQINREFGQTWLVGLSYSRNVRHLETVSEPLFSDSVTLGVQGSFSRRLQYQSRAGWSSGRVGQEGNTFDTYFGTIQLSFALNRLLAIGTDYSLYRYSVDSGNLPISTFGATNSQSLRTYLQLWLPLISKTKRP